MNSQARAIPFILKNPKTQDYQLGQQAQDFLKSIKGPISIVTVAGLYRTGKSYLLNRVILSKGQGFNVGPTINPCTKGLWIWNQSIRTPDNKNVLVIDTQGLGALDQQANHDMKIFSLAVLLSTTFIYNSVGNIDENALQTLSLVLNIVSSIDQQNQSARPSFIWVVRDFSLQLVDQNGRTINPNQYLQLALSSDSSKESQKTQIRKNITKAFSQRDCFTLYKPLIDENKLQRLDSVPLQELRPEFVSQTMALRKKIFSSLTNIKLSNSELKGSQYLIMVKKYMNAINQGKVPNIMDTWTFIKEQKSREVCENIFNQYSQKIKNKIMPRFPVKFAQLEGIMNGIWSEMLNDFKRLSYEDSSCEDLQQFFQSIKQEVKYANEDQTKIFLKNLLTKQFEPISKKMYSDCYDSIESFSSQVQKSFRQALLSTYSQKVEGLNGSLSSFLQKKYLQASKYFTAKLKLQLKRISQNKDDMQTNYKNQIRNLNNNSSKYQDELKLKINQLDRNLIQVMRKNQEYQKLLEFQRQSNKGKGMQMRQKNQTYHTTLHQLQQRVHLLQDQKQKLHKQMFVSKKQNDKQTALLKQKNEYLSRQYQQYQKRYQDMKRLLDQKMNIQQQQKKKFFSLNQQKFKSLIEQNQKKSDKIFELQQKLLQIHSQFNDNIYKLQQRERKLEVEKQRMKQSMIQDFSNKKETQSHQIMTLRSECQKYEQQFEINLIQRTELENKVRTVSQQLKHAKYSAEKQIAIHIQRIQFHEAEIKELKNSNEQIKRNYQSTIDSLQSSTRNTDQKYQARIKEIVQQYELQIRSMDKDLNQKLYQAKKQISSLKTTKQDLQIEISVQRKKQQSKQKQFKQSYGKLESLYKNITQKLSTSQTDFHNLNRQKQHYFANRIKQLQAQLQENKQKYTRQIDQNQRNSQQALVVLKNYAEMDKIQWQKRLGDQRDKHIRTVQSIKLQLQKKLMEQKQALVQQNSALQDKIDQMQRYFNQTLQNMKYESEIQMQKLSNQFMQEKVQLSKKNALLSQQIQLTRVNMQNQIQEQKRNFQHSVQSLKQQLQTELKQQQHKFREEKQFIENKYQSLKRTNKCIEEQNLMLKGELDKERALWKERQAGHLRNINDLEQKLSHQLFNHTKTIEEITNANTMQRKRLNSQIDNLKTHRTRLQQQKTQLCMDRDALQTRLTSKVTYLQSKIRGNKNDYDDLMTKFETVSKFLNNKITQVNRQKQEISSKIRTQFEHQISIKEDNYKREHKEYNDRIYRLQTENKSLRDKVILLEVKLGSQTKTNYESIEFEKLEEVREQYQRREQEYKKLIEKLKKDNKKLKDEREILQLTNNYEKSKHNSQKQYNNKEYNQMKDQSTGYNTGYKEFSERDSIINGLQEYSRNDGSRSRLNMDNSKILNNSQFSQSRLSNVSALTENKNVVNRKSSVSPMVGNLSNNKIKDYSSKGNFNNMANKGNRDNYEGNNRYY